MLHRAPWLLKYDVWTCIDLHACVAVRAIPQPSEASTSADARPRTTLRNVWRLLQDVADLPLLGTSAEAFKAKLSAFLASEQACSNALQQRQARLQQFLASLSESDNVVSGSHIDDLISALARL